MADRNKTLKIILCSILFFQILVNLTIAKEKPVSFVKIELKQGRFILNSEETSLGEILDRIRRKCNVEISGLKNREDELITFSSQGGTLQEELKRLLRYLCERNCACEFIDEKLIRISVLSEAKSNTSSSPAPLNKELMAREFVNVLKIQSIIDGSQAQTLDLLEGDRIVEYDRVIISTLGQLIGEVQKKSYKDHVEMIVVRENVPRQIVLNGGFVGLRIKTGKIPKEDLEYCCSELNR
jgi:hypothetical protein